MSPDGTSSPPNFFVRLGLWFVCCLALAAPICFAFSKGGSLDAGLRFALLFALPAWLLYIPLILALKDAKSHRIWIILGCGLLLGPIMVAVSCGIAIAQGERPGTAWEGDPLGPSTVTLMVLSAFVTLALAGIYGACLKVLGHRSEPR